MTKRCDDCLAVFEAQVDTCPFCGQATKDEAGTSAKLAEQGYMVVPSRSTEVRRSALRGHVAAKKMTSIPIPPSSASEVGFAPKAASVKIDDSDVLERLRSGYKRSVAQTRQDTGVSSTSGPTDRQDPGPAASDGVDVTEDPSAVASDIMSFLRGEAQEDPSESVDDAGFSSESDLTATEVLDTAMPSEPLVQDGSAHGLGQDDLFETYRQRRDRADRELRQLERREARGRFLTELGTPGTLPHSLLRGALLLLGAWLLIVCVLPVMLNMVVSALIQMLPYVIVLAILVHIFRRSLRL